jgi:hypothetical protein
LSRGEGWVGAVTLVVLDTNQWDRMPMLRHRLASTLLFVLQQNGMTLLLPEIVRHEVETHVVEKHRTAARKLEQALGEIRQILGEAPDYEQSSDAQVRKALQARLDELGDLLEEDSITPEDHAAAGEMVLKVLPPNTPASQQFKDSLLWRAVVRASRDDEVVLVTNDGGFYAAGDANDLADPLRQEVEDSDHHEVTCYRTVEQFMDAWQPQDFADFLEAIQNELVEAIRDQVDDVVPQYTQLVAGDALVSVLDAFVTQTPGELVLSGSFEFELMHPDWDDAEPVGVAFVEGSATVQDEGVESASLDQVSIQLMTPHGDTTLASVVFGRTASSLGTAMRPYRHRERIELR